jgi:hypothetical protein
MPGFFSRVGTYMAGAGRQGLAQMAANPALRRTAIGAAMGGAYGGMSGDTSVLGGALMGAGLARYGGAGMLAASRSGRGLGFMGSVKAYGTAFGGGVANLARRDAMRVRMAGRSARMAANRGYGKIRGLF